MLFASSQIFRSVSGWPLPAPLVALHYFSLLILAISIASFGVFLTLFGAWLCFMSPSAFERRITWWIHRFSAPHRNIRLASRDELTLEPVFDEVYRESFWMLRTPFGDYDCYPDTALARLLPQEFDLERRVLRLDESASTAWRLFLRSRPTIDEKTARVEELEAVLPAVML